MMFQRLPIPLIALFIVPILQAQSGLPGEWSSTTPYIKGDLVIHDDETYLAQRESTNVEPGTSTADWETLDELSTGQTDPGDPPEDEINPAETEGLGDPGDPDSDSASGAKIVRVNIRGTVSSGEGARIVSFRLGFDSGSSTTTSDILMRGIGPGLAAFGHTDYLPDPTMYVAQFLDAGGAETLSGGTNDNWATNANSSTINSSAASISPVIAFSDKDSAVQLTLEEGFYTLPVNTADGQSGVAWVGADKVTASDDARFTHCSCRGSVGTGDDVMILSFEITGESTDTTTVLVQGRGPSLKNLGVTSGVLADPTMYVSTLAGEVVSGGTNDDWTTVGNASINTNATSLTFNVGLDDKDCGLILTLSPGYYSAVLSGVGGGTGIGWVAVDEITE